MNGVRLPLQMVVFFLIASEGVNNGSRDRGSQVKCKWLLRPLEGIGDLAKGLPEFISFFPRLSALFLLFPPLVPIKGRGTEIASKGQYWA